MTFVVVCTKLETFAKQYQKRKLVKDLPKRYFSVDPGRSKIKIKIIWY